MKRFVLHPFVFGLLTGLVNILANLISLDLGGLAVLVCIMVFTFYLAANQRNKAKRGFVWPSFQMAFGVVLIVVCHHVIFVEPKNRADAADKATVVK